MTKARTLILIVDDELEICMILGKYLQNLGFDTQYALTVREARVKLLSSPFDVMFLDLNLTDGSGFELINYKDLLSLKTKIIVISAYDGEASKAMDAGASFFLAKPFATKRINEALESLNILPRNLIA